MSDVYEDIMWLCEEGRNIKDRVDLVGRSVKEEWSFVDIYNKYEVSCMYSYGDKLVKFRMLVIIIDSYYFLLFIFIFVCSLRKQIHLKYCKSNFKWLKVSMDELK